jgi:serine/threonine protein kinase
MPHDHFLMFRIVHLDLKSCNVLIGGDGTAKISDVGLAVLIRDRYLSMTAPAGTFAWVAPEVILGGADLTSRDPFRAIVDIHLLRLRHAMQRWLCDMP